MAYRAEKASRHAERKARRAAKHEAKRKEWLKAQNRIANGQSPRVEKTAPGIGRGERWRKS